MPEICRFYGIVIKMFFKPREHEPSHIHALYGEHIGVTGLTWQQIEKSTKYWIISAIFMRIFQGKGQWECCRAWE